MPYSQNLEHLQSSIFHPSGLPMRNSEQQTETLDIFDPLQNATKNNEPQSNDFSLPRRRNREAQRPKDASDRIFACTFCPDTFKTKYDWARHEKSIHIDVDVWVCSPKDGTTNEPFTNKIICVYCSSTDPTPQHLQEHNHQACDQISRKFSRKDHLVQHLRATHGLTNIPDLSSWREDLHLFTCRCGFCGSNLGSWKERVDHLTQHFRQGLTREQWDGDHGFPEDIAKHVRNSVYPMFATKIGM